jgi:phosphate starvation-inducible protein PhoH and related proteins
VQAQVRICAYLGFAIGCLAITPFSPPLLIKTLASEPVEKIILLESISLPDFLGVANQHINQVAHAFPHSRIISRGNEIRIKGSPQEINKISDIVQMLIDHFNRYGKINAENIESYIRQDEERQDFDQSDNILLYGAKGVVVRARTANQQKMVASAKENDIVFALGPAGTGKTYTAVALAVRALKNKEVRKIIITRPAVEAGENLGFLPGDLKEKIDPYLRPIYDALDDMIVAEKLKLYQENRTIEIAPLAYMRGRTLNNAFILLDEAQNTTPMQIKMFLTRMGPNSKVIVTGDPSQTDLPTRQKSGLSEAIHILKGIKGLGIVQLDAADVVRHRLVRDIIIAYDKHEGKDKDHRPTEHKTTEDLPAPVQ